MIVMDEMIYEDVIDQYQEPESMTVVQQRKEKGPAVKSNRPPVARSSFDTSSATRARH